MIFLALCLWGLMAMVSIYGDYLPMHSPAHPLLRITKPMRMKTTMGNGLR